MAIGGSVGAARRRGLPVAVVGGQRRGVGGVAVKRKVLVELVHVEGLHVADDIGAELRDVDVAEVDVLPAAVDEAAAFMFQILLHPVVQVCLGSSWRCRRTMRLT